MDITIEHVPEIEIVYENELAVLDEIGAKQAESLVTRAEQGLGARGPLPRTKDGPPMRRTGTLLSSVRHVTREDPRAGRSYVIVRAHGDRPEEERGAEKRRRAAVRQRERRAALAVALTLGALGGQAIPAQYRRARPDARGNVLRLGRVRVRAGETNAAVAAILSVRPRDLRSSNGGRGTYVVFAPSPVYEEIAQSIARERLIVRAEER